MKKLLRHSILSIGVLASSFLPAISTAADNFPNKPITYIVPFAPGGASDIGGRILSEALSKELKQTVVVENKTGAAGTIGLGQLIRSAPDGHTLSIVVPPNLLAPYLMPTAPYDLSKDVKAVGLTYLTPTVIAINPKFHPNIKDLNSLIQAAKDSKNGLNYATVGVGSTGHLSMELLAKDLNIKLEHIPFRGSSPGVTALLAGEIDFMFSDIVSLLSHLDAGTLIPIAVGTDDRLSQLPNVPTIKEQNPKANTISTWTGIVVPAQTPDAIVDKLSAALKKVLENPELQERLTTIGAIPYYRDGAFMQKRIVDDSAFWNKIIQDNNLQQKN